MTNKEVKSGTDTTLDCSVTELRAAVQITWHLTSDGDALQDEDNGECSARKSQGKYRRQVNNFTP